MVSQNLLATVLVLLLISALATQWIGIHAIFGAFILGALMPKLGGFVRELSEKLEDFATVFFLPVYVAYTGLRTQIGLLDSVGAWLIALMLLLVAVVGKMMVLMAIITTAMTAPTLALLDRNGDLLPAPVEADRRCRRAVPAEGRGDGERLSPRWRADAGH